MSELDSLDYVRKQRGQPPINPHMIEGFGDGAPPPPPTFFQEDEEYLRETATQTAAPPLASALAFNPAMVVRQAAPEKDPVLVIADHAAIYKGHEATLSEAEQAAIASIVLRSIARRIKTQQEELLKSLPKRVRVRRTASEEVAATKRRGRPKKETPAA
jgi:hypothetical protein